MVPPPDVTALLEDWSRGNSHALDQLLPLVYAELRRIAARHLRKERVDHTLQPTALVHEVYLRLIDVPVPSIYGPTADEPMPGLSPRK